MEAMLFAVDAVNSDPRVLPWLRLGVSIKDTCSRDTYALEQSLEYVRSFISMYDDSKPVCTDGSRPSFVGTPAAVSGVVGGSYSSVSARVANLLRLFKIPQVSYASTSAALSDKTRFEYFARTVPPDNFQAKAMADVVKHFNWSYVSTIASSGEYGERGIDSFHQEARHRNICIAVSVKLPHSPVFEDFTDAVQQFKRKSTAKVIVLFLRVEDARQLMTAARTLNDSMGFIWVASDGWGKQDIPVKEGNQEIAAGALTVDLQSTSLPGFDEYFMALNPDHNKRNPWFREYWQVVNKCYFRTTNRNQTKCTNQPQKFYINKYQQEGKIHFVYNAVYAFAHALHNMIMDTCDRERDSAPFDSAPFDSAHSGGRPLTAGEEMKRQADCANNLVHTLDSSRLYKEFLLKIKFNDSDGAVVQFDQQGDSVGRYDVMNFRRNPQTGVYGYSRVGTWSANSLSINAADIVWGNGLDSPDNSRCSEPCLVGQIKQTQPGETCCWVCTYCRSHEKVGADNLCVDCGDGRWPTRDKRNCFDLRIEYMHFYSIYAIGPLCLSALGIILTIFVMVTFAKYFETPVVKASGRELSYMLLVGFLVCYSMTFALLAAPSIVICVIQRFGIGFGLSFIYAPLLTKTNRISRIFHSASKSAKRPPFISPKSQVTITMILIGVQLIYSGVWLLVEPAGTRTYHPEHKRDIYILACKRKDESFLLSLVYIIMLIITCTVYAVKTRKIPENFNESKCIGFAMYTTCVVWLAFIPIYFGTLHSHEIQTTTLCVAISLSASVALFCLFTPKMYVLLIEPQKNVRRHTSYATVTAKSVTENENRGHVTSCHAGSSMADDIVEAKELESNKELERLSTIEVADNGISRI